VRRVFIPKGKENGVRWVPTRDDRLVRSGAQLLERIYEPVFSNASHGFRREVVSRHLNMSKPSGRVKWLVDVDVAGFFDNIDHDVLLTLLRKRIDDEKFVGLIGTC
jgi:RNA-directed DNA polymerase